MNKNAFEIDFRHANIFLNALTLKIKNKGKCGRNSKMAILYIKIHSQNVIGNPGTECAAITFIQNKIIG